MSEIESDGDDVDMVLAQPVAVKGKGKHKKGITRVSPLDTLGDLRKQIDQIAELLDEIACEAQKEETALSQIKPSPAKTPPPQIVVETMEVHDGTPTIVRKMLSEMGPRRKQIEEMWKKEGRTQTYIPGSEAARKMKVAARIENRIETRHAQLVREIVEKNQVALDQPEAVVVAAVPIG